ncbi:hypothetical protein [Kiloniella sp. b19]|uniref:hypothetical protein n=1 Tax=Kiloniella sp. GXU_MW_B19 TaxID=3141326 RepID=UPI0031D6C8E7
MTPIALSEKSVELSFKLIRQQKLKTLAVTAVRQNEGVSAFAYALARRVATAHSRVLLIDMNMINCGQSKNLGENSVEWCPGKLDPRKDISRLASTNLALLSAPSHLRREWIFQDGSTLEKMLQSLSEEYDLIIADLPPLLEKPSEIHTESLCSAFDKTLMIALSGSSDETQLSAARDLLEKAGVRLLGLVINDRHCPSLADELKRQLTRLFFVPASVKGLLNRWLQDNSFLNQEF